MIKRVHYKHYKQNQRIYNAVANSYDAETKTIEVIIPDVEIKDFRNCKNFKRNGNCYAVIDNNGNYTGVRIYQWNTGANANFMIENSNATRENHTITIDGTGAIAKTKAIETALNLANLN